MRVRSPRRSLAFALSLAVTCGSSGLADAAGLNVLEYLADPVATRDLDGRLVGTVATAELPPTPVAVVDVQRGAVLIVTASGKGVWLDRDDVKLDRSGSVRHLCNSLDVASGAEQVAAMKIATGASCARQLAP